MITARVIKLAMTNAMIKTYNSYSHRYYIKEK